MATKEDGSVVTFTDLPPGYPVEIEYYQNGGILQTVLRRLAKEA